ncbi:MAG TPA: MarR family transcriptional regulator [Streptosporangiaceae bacterium]|jgi:DNA-binding MarR family transcriptional regulator|nr:MarR family transcriptional regulator [Streptosporangiaceae bacterium]
MPAPSAHPGDAPPAPPVQPGDEQIAAIETALHSLARRLMKGRLHDHLAREAGVEIDQAGLAVLYVLNEERSSLRVTDIAARLGIDAPAVTRKAQQLERMGLVTRERDAGDARASRLQLSPEGRRVFQRFLLARHRWLTTMLADWPDAERCEFARLIGRFTEEVHCHLDELNR